MEKSFKLMVQYATNSTDAPTRPQFRRWVKAALMQEAEIVLRIVDEAEGCELNHQFRDKDDATNVLTFVYDDTQPLTGDIVLCAPVVSKESQQQLLYIRSVCLFFLLMPRFRNRGWNSKCSPVLQFFHNFPLQLS